MKVVWLPRAIANRDALIDHIAEANVTAAIEHDERIEVLTNQLEDQGRPGRKSGTRELVINRTHFILVYRIKASSIVIVRLLHTSQAWTT